MRFVDFHCDTVGCLAKVESEGVGLRSNHFHVDLEKMQLSAALLQCFALYIETTPEGIGPKGESPYEIYEKELHCYEREMKKNADLIRPVLCFDDIAKNQKAGKMSSLLTVEDAVPLDGKIERVKEFYDDGVRLLTFTWNYENSLGWPNGSAQELGLKPFGFEVLEQLNSLGMIADVSHLSDDYPLAFNDYTGMPLIEEALNKVFTAAEVDKITHENALRVIKECIG